MTYTTVVAVIGEPYSCVVSRSRQLDLFRGTLAPFFRASERPMAMACFRLLTLPPFPLFPDLSVPVFFRCIALFTDFPAARPYLAIVSSYPNLTGTA